MLLICLTSSFAILKILLCIRLLTISIEKIMLTILFPYNSIWRLCARSKCDFIWSDSIISVKQQFLQTKNTALSIYKFQNVTIPLLDNKASSKFKNKSFSFILLYSTFPCGFVVAKSFRFRLWIRVFVFVIISSLLRKWSVCIRGQYITYKTSLWRTIIHLLRVM